jgi:hypothetical protein
MASVLLSDTGNPRRKAHRVIAAQPKVRSRPASGKNAAAMLSMLGEQGLPRKKARSP